MSAPETAGAGEVSQSVQRPLKARTWRDSVLRPGALDYRDIPSVAGEERLAHTGPTGTSSVVRPSVGRK